MHSARAAHDEEYEDLLGLWGDLESGLSVLLARPQHVQDFSAKVRQFDHWLQELVTHDIDAALYLMFQLAATSTVGYSASHALVCAVLCHLIGTELGIAPEEREGLVYAALTMNIAMTTLQDELAQQLERPNARQTDAIDRNGGGQEPANQGDLHARVGQLETDPHGQQAADEQKEETGPKVLQANHLVVERPDVFGEEALLVLVVPVLDGRGAGAGNEGCRACAHSLFSLLRGAGPDGSLAAVEVRRARAAAAAFASSALAAILPACHLANSSWETTRIGAFML